MKMMIPAILMTMVIPFQALADVVPKHWRSGTFLESCTSSNELADAMCLMYFNGYNAGLQGAYKINEFLYSVGHYYPELEHSYQLMYGCPPSGVSAIQFKQVWAKYMREHPEDLNKDFRETIPRSLSIAFPCE